MDEAIFRDKLDRLREGEMILPPPGQNEIGKHARKHLPDLMEYSAALEAGYRTLTGRLSTYRNVAGERALGRIVKNQWSSPAALGYAAAALRQSGMNPSQVVGVLDLMEEIMDEFPRAWAEGVYMEMLKDPGGVRAGRLPALQKTGRGTRHLRGTRGTDCRGKRGGQGSGRPTPRNDKAGDGE